MTEATTADTAGSSGGPLQDQVVDEALKEADNRGITFDEACLRTTVAGLSDADAQLILDAGITGDPDVSPEGEAIATAIRLFRPDKLLLKQLFRTDDLYKLVVVHLLWKMIARPPLNIAVEVSIIRTCCGERFPLCDDILA